MMISPQSSSSSFELLDERIKRWIWEQKWDELRVGQELAIPALLEDHDVVLAAPTSAGKTEAAFFPILTRILAEPKPSIRALYISPLKALINDQFGRLEQLCDVLDVAVHRWHGDVNQSARDRLLKSPSGILLITPESLEALLMNQASHLRRIFAHLSYVVIDELHSFFGNERGAQVRSLLSRIEDCIGHATVRVGLSATIADLGIAAEFLRPRDPGRVKRIEAHGKGGMKAQIRAYLNDVIGDSEDLEARPTIANTQIVRHLFDTLRSDHSLVFANSRGRVEEYADALHQLSKEEQVPDVFLAHHGNLSKELREEAERRLRSREVPAVCVCTSTLEMGIDIGAMKSVAQVGVPPSVASLRQRVGRSGRRGEPSVLRMYAAEDFINPKAKAIDRLRLQLVQQIAALELLVERWCEPPPSAVSHYSTLVQQIMSVIVERGGASIPFLFDVLCARGTFRNVHKSSFIELLRAMKAADLLQQVDDGTVLLGSKGERLTSHFSFYAAFATPEEFRIAHGSHTLGTMPVDSLIRENDNILFGGRRWRVVGVDDERRVISVVPSSGGKAPLFGGEGGGVHERLRQKMKFVLESDYQPTFLDSQAGELLAEARRNFAELELADRVFLSEGAQTYLFHWSGDSQALTLNLLLDRKGIKATISGVALSAASSQDEVIAALAEIAAEDPADPVELAAAMKVKRVNKHDWVVPEPLLNREFAARELDVPGAVLLAKRLLGTAPEAARVGSSTVQKGGIKVNSELISVLAGERSIGGTKILLSEQGQDVLLDFGLDFSQYGRYFEEFLRPRSTRGLMDLWHFHLVPHLGNAYRHDLQSPGDAFEADRYVEPAGILLSHAHVDHFGMIGTIRTDVPLHASALSLAIMKSSQDSGRLDFWSEAVYTRERTVSHRDPRALEAKGEILGRSCEVIGDLNEPLMSFLTRLPSEEAEARFKPGATRATTGRIGPFNYTSWPVDHSLPGCLGFRIETERGSIAYTGDLRLHGAKGEMTSQFVNDLSKDPPEILICEGTRVTRPEDRRISETEVKDKALALVKEAGGKLVIADFGPRHVERLSAFLDIATETDRRLVITTKDAYLLQAIGVAAPELSLMSSSRVAIYDEVRATPTKWEASVKAEFASRLVTAGEIKEGQGWYILAFSFFDCNELVDVLPYGALYIYSGSEAYGEDQCQDLRRLWAWCKEFDIEVKGFALDGKKLTFHDALNASGHASADDLKFIIQSIRPRRLLPVHRTDESTAWFEALCRELAIKLYIPGGATF